MVKMGINYWFNYNEPKQVTFTEGGNGHPYGGIVFHNCLICGGCGRVWDLDEDDGDEIEIIEVHGWNDLDEDIRTAY